MKISTDWFQVFLIDFFVLFMPLKDDMNMSTDGFMLHVSSSSSYVMNMSTDGFMLHVSSSSSYVMKTMAARQ
jgi:hypothetical protein